MLATLGGVVDEAILDLYAGSGSFGIESLSRGANHVTFVEQDREAQAVLGKNLDTLGFADQATIITRPVARAWSNIEPVGIAFCDPPYADDPWTEIFESVQCKLLVGHAQSPIELPPQWEELKRREYGRSRIVIARPVTA